MLEGAGGGVDVGKACVGRGATSRHGGGTGGGGFPKFCRFNVVFKGGGTTGVSTYLATAGSLAPDCIISRFKYWAACW